MSLWPTLLLLSRTRNASLATPRSVHRVNHSVLDSTTIPTTTSSRSPRNGRSPVSHRPIPEEGSGGSSSRQDDPLRTLYLRSLRLPFGQRSDRLLQAGPFCEGLLPESTGCLLLRASDLRLQLQLASAFVP